jgi:hypothetical protein
MNLPTLELPPLPIGIGHLSEAQWKNLEKWARLAIEQDRARRIREPVAWVHGFEHRFNKEGFRATVSFVHHDHWTDEYWKPLYL